MSILQTLLERAKQGDAGAIAALMNDVLQPQEIWVKATLDADCLQVMLKAPTVLNQATCIAFIRRGLLRLQPAAIAQVRAYAWRVGDAFPLWIAAFSLEQPLLNAQSVALLEPPLSNAGLEGNSSDGTPAASQSPTLVLPSSATVQRRSEFFKLGFVIVIVTMVYFVVAGV